jgi:hypothetical protein
MKATTAITLLAAWIWLFQGCDSKAHHEKSSSVTTTNQLRMP